MAWSEPEANTLEAEALQLLRTVRDAHGNASLLCEQDGACVIRFAVRRKWTSFLVTRRAPSWAALVELLAFEAQGKPVRQAQGKPVRQAQGKEAQR